MARIGMVPLYAAGIAALVTGAAAMADISETVFVVQATNANGTGTYVAQFNQGRMEQGGNYQWQLPGTMCLQSQNGSTVAMLNQAVILGNEDPDVTLSFNVFAGSVETTFTVTSATVSFSSMAGAQGRASGSLSITDLNGDGVTLHHSAGSAGAFTAYFNGAPPSGTVFHNLFASPITTAISGDTVTASEDFPGGGAFSPIPGTVTNISSQFQFTLSPNDMASGTSVFTIQPIPSPGAIALLGLGGLVALRRQRR